MEDVDYALDSMRYLHDMQKGKAEIRDVVEKVSDRRIAAEVTVSARTHV